jgi:dephospho-CoA kinase
VLRVGLTGGLGSGKSTVAELLKQKGAFLIEADELGRKLMEPGQQVFAQIVARFGDKIIEPNGELDRAQLAKIAFTDGRVQELNAIIHPAVIEAQAEWMRSIIRKNPNAIAVVESALIFEVERDARLRGEREGLLADWRRRFDRIVVVTAPDEVRIARYVAKLTPPGLTGKALASVQQKLTADARARIAQQITQEEKAQRADIIIINDGDEAALDDKVEKLWLRLKNIQHSTGPGE